MELALGKKIRLMLVLSTILFFGMAVFAESSAWARAGRGASSGSRGSRSYSTPASPSKPNPGFSTQGRNPAAATPGQTSGGFFSRSPFMQGLAGGLAGGMLGSLLFGGVGHAASGGYSGGGIGFMDIALIGLILYLIYRFIKRRRVANEAAYYSGGAAPGQEGNYDAYQGGYSNTGWSAPEAPAGHGELERGFEAIRSYDQSFDPERFKETAQDLFFRIQAGWTNRSLDGIGNILTDEMSALFLAEFETMKQKGVINRLENIAVRKVEFSEAWQEMGKDYITVLFTANLLDYTVDAATRELVQGDKMNPVKFQEFWTFTRDVGSSRWQLSAINQVEN